MKNQQKNPVGRLYEQYNGVGVRASSLEWLEKEGLLLLLLG